MIKRQNKKTRFILTTLLLIVVVLVVGFGGFKKSKSLAAGDGNMNGYVWSENIGWINTNNNSNYKVGISNTDGSISGYAWSENIGWLDFAPAGPYPDGTTTKAKIDLQTGAVSGWARIVSLKNEYVTGWIKLRGTNYGLVFDLATGKIKGDLTNLSNPNRWAWSDEVGWLDFKGINLQNVVQVTANALNINISVKRSGQDISTSGPGQRVTVTKSGSNIYDICTALYDPNSSNTPGTCSNPVRIGDKLDVTSFLVDQFGLPFTGGSYSSTCKLTVIDTITRDPVVSVCKSTANLPNSGISGTFSLPLNQSGTIELTVKGNGYSKIIRIRVPSIGTLE